MSLLLIPESSQIPRLCFSFTSNEEINSSASLFNQKLFEMLNSNQFSLDLQFDLDLKFSELGNLNAQFLTNLEDFFSTGFLGLKSTILLENLKSLSDVLKKHKNYLSNLGVSLEKLDNVDSLKVLFQGLQQQNLLASLRFSIHQLNKELGFEFFKQLSGIGQKLTTLTLDFEKQIDADLVLEKAFWPEFPYLKRLKLTFNHYEAPSIKTFFDGIQSLLHLVDFELFFKGNAANNDLLANLAQNMDFAEFPELSFLTVEIHNDCEAEILGNLLGIIQKKAQRLEGLTLGFSKSPNFVINGLNHLNELIYSIAKSPGTLSSLGLRLIESGLANETELNTLSESLSGLEFLTSFELDLTNNKSPGPPLVTILKKLENMMKNLKFLRLFLGWNQVTDEIGRQIFSEIEKFTGLEYLIYDLSQNYSGSHYMNGALANDFLASLEKLTNLKVLLVNLEGNEFKENNYWDIEASLVQWKSQDKMPLNFFKVFRKSEIYGVSQAEPNLTYYGDYAQHFPQTKKISPDCTLVIPNLSFEFFGSFFDNMEVIKNFIKFSKSLKIKTATENISLKLRNPPQITNDPTNRCPLKELFTPDADGKNSFDKVSLDFTNIFQASQGNNIKIKLHLGSEKTDFKELNTPKDSLYYITNFNAGTMNFLVEHPKNFETFARNKILAYVLTQTMFEEFFKMIPPHEVNLQSIFINSVFANCLILDFPSQIPAFLLSNLEYSKYLTSEALSLLRFYGKTLIEMGSKAPKTHQSKVSSLREIHLKSNPNISLKIWKEKLLKEFENAWNSSFLKTPKDFVENSFFEAKNTSSIAEDQQIKDDISSKHNEFKEILMKLDFPNLSNYYQDFLLDLVMSLPELKKIDFEDRLAYKNWKKPVEEEKKGIDEEKKQAEEEKIEEKKMETPKKDKLDEKKEMGSSGKKEVSLSEDVKESDISSFVGEALFSQDLILEEKGKKDSCSDLDF